MENWTDSIVVTVGQRVTVEVGLLCIGNCVVQVTATNPTCSVAYSISETSTSTQTENNDLIQSIEVVKVVDSQENCATRVSITIPNDGTMTVDCFVVSGEASILRASLALD